MDSPRTPPQASAAEGALIAGLLLDPAALDRVAERVAAADFYRRDARTTFAAIAALAAAGKPFDVVAVGEALEAAGELEAVGGLPGLGTLAQAAGSSASAAHYADLIASAAASRRLISAASRAMEAAYAEPPEAVAATLAGELDAIGQGRAPGGFRCASEILGRVIEAVERRYYGEQRPTVPLGLADLDHALGGGLEAGQLCLLAARPSMGKSALAAQAARHAAAHAGPVAYFSLEMDGQNVMERLLSAQARIRYHHIRADCGKIDEREWPRLSAATARLAELPLHISDRPNLTLTRLRAECRRLKREAGALALIVVDYLGLMSPEGKTDNQVQAIAALSRGLKLAAMELAAPILALAQLNRGPENRPNPYKRPTLADLRDSGSLEQDADVVAFVYRDEVYNEGTPDKGIAEIIIGKQRNGPIGTVRAAWLADYASFGDLAPFSADERPF